MAINEERQPLLQSRLPHQSRNELSNLKDSGGCTDDAHRTLELGIQQKKRSQSLSGLVASNDFFIPCPLTSVGQYPPSSSGREIPTPRKEVFADSLRGQYTPRYSTKSGDVGRMGHCPAGILERAIKVRESNWRIPHVVGADQDVSELERKLHEQGITPIYCPEPISQGGTCINFNNIAATMIYNDLRLFLMRPMPPDCGFVECHIRRHVPSKWPFLPSYKVYLSDGDRFLLSSKRQRKTKSNYIISLDEQEISKHSGNYFGKLQSNFVGSEFWFYDKGTPHVTVEEKGVHGSPRLPTVKNQVEMGAIKYHVNFLGIGGPRRMTAILPSLQEDGKACVFSPAPNGGPSLLHHYKNDQYRDKMVVLHNKQPHFNKKLAAYCLNFNGRVTKPSVKNFQLVTSSNKDTIILQFGKLGRNLFTMDYRHPMSALQAVNANHRMSRDMLADSGCEEIGNYRPQHDQIAEYQYPNGQPMSLEDGIKAWNLT